MVARSFHSDFPNDGDITCILKIHFFVFAFMNIIVWGKIMSLVTAKQTIKYRTSNNVQCNLSSSVIRCREAKGEYM